MSQSRGGQVSETTSVARNDSSLIQERLSARQAKRATKAAERREKSDVLKEAGNTFFRDGKFLDAVERYKQAIDVHGPSVKPVLLANLAAVYLKLGMYTEAHDAADKALAGDPKSVKARYRRGIARKHMEMWTAADIDFRTLLTLDPDNRVAETELASLEERRRDSSYLEEEEDMNSYSDHEAPALEDDPDLGESLSESSNCEHTGNGIPCKFYNRAECKNGRACRYSHAPDQKSERDALGRNVCRYYLIGVCKFGERCSYLHSKEYLLQQGWWSTAEGVDKERKRYEVVRMLNKATANYNNQTKASRTGQTAKKKQLKGKKKGEHSRSGLGVSGSGVPRVSPSEIGESSQRMSTKSKKKPIVYSDSRWGGYDLDGDDDNGMFGFTGSEVEELLCQGVKPWDDDARDVLDALYDYY
ncbi:hypothetical protein EV363DRAFT_1316886 [Boletus edulis]|nr:hypothetical protein EV363DRAFT_1316886 [Boletus edulis]